MDCTKEFDKAGHSSDAKKDFKKYKIGEIIEVSEQGLLTCFTNRYFLSMLVHLVFLLLSFYIISLNLLLPVFFNFCNKGVAFFISFVRKIAK